MTSNKTEQSTRDSLKDFVPERNSIAIAQRAKENRNKWAYNRGSLDFENWIKTYKEREREWIFNDIFLFCAEQEQKKIGEAIEETERKLGVITGEDAERFWKEYNKPISENVQEMIKDSVEVYKYYSKKEKEKDRAEYKAELQKEIQAEFDAELSSFADKQEEQLKSAWRYEQRNKIDEAVRKAVEERTREIFKDIDLFLEEKLDKIYNEKYEADDEPMSFSQIKNELLYYLESRNITYSKEVSDEQKKNNDS
jgi:hypothetical protein